MAEGGRYIGKIPETHPYADPFTAPLEALHPKLLGNLSPEEFMKTRPAGEEGFMLPDSELLWITKPPTSESIPMSYLDPEVQNG